MEEFKTLKSQNDTEQYFLDWFRRKLPEWKEDPVQFSREVLGINPVGEQRKLLMALAKGDKVAVKAGRAVGKSVIAGVAAVWFITVNYNSLVLITSPNFQQLKDVIFGTVKEAYRTSPLLKMMFDVTDETFRHKELRATWMIVIKTSTTPEGIRGYNRPNKLYITDETTGISDDILAALLGSIDESNSKMLMISNPTKKNGTFYDIFTDPTSYPEWSRVSMSRLLTGYQIISLTSKEKADKIARHWARQMKVFGKNHPKIRIEILGEFPLQDNSMAFDMDLFKYAGRNNPFKGKAIKEIESINLGVDIAGEGGDSIVFTTNKLNYDYANNRVRQFIKPKEYFDVLYITSRQNYNHSRNMLVELSVGLVKEHAEIENSKFKMLYINVDATGVGQAFCDMLSEALEGNKTLVAGHELRKWVRIVRTQFQEKAFAEKHYTNKRSEMGEQFRHKLEKNQVLVMEKKEPIVYINMDNPTMFRGINREISIIGKEYDNKSRVRYESKSKIRERIKGASTDTADSLFLSSYIRAPRNLWYI